jgi:hypothetical protein
LPQDFAAIKGTSAAPAQPFNDMNREEKSRYVDAKECDYIAVMLDDLTTFNSDGLRDSLKRALRDALRQKKDEEERCRTQDGGEFCSSAPVPTEVSPLQGLLVKSAPGIGGSVVNGGSYSVVAASKVLDSARSTSAFLRAFYIPGPSENANRMKDYLILKKI